MISTQRDVILIFGQTGAGKTFTAAKHFKTRPRAIVAEAGFSEFDALRFDDYQSMVLHLDRIGAGKNPNIPFRLSFSPDYHEYEEVFKCGRALTNTWIYVDEADLAGDPRDNPALGYLVRRGRHVGVSLCFMYLRPYDCPIILRSQATSIICYRQTEPDDILWMKKKVGDIADELPNLIGPSGPPPAKQPPFPFLEWGGGKPARVITP